MRRSASAVPFSSNRTRERGRASPCFDKADKYHIIGDTGSDDRLYLGLGSCHLLVGRRKSCIEIYLSTSEERLPFCNPNCRLIGHESHIIAYSCTSKQAAYRSPAYSRLLIKGRTGNSGKYGVRTYDHAGDTSIESPSSATCTSRPRHRAQPRGFYILKAGLTGQTCYWSAHRDALVVLRGFPARCYTPYTTIIDQWDKAARLSDILRSILLSLPSSLSR